MSDQRLTQFRHAGLTFDVIDSGPVDGTPVVLLHGFPQRATCWAAVSEQLNAEGLRTYALDQRGYSPGARPGSRFDYRVSELVGDVVALIDEIGQPVHLVGHDWGSAVAWAVAAHHPESLRTLTAVSVPHPGAFAKSMVSSPQLLKSYYMLLFQLPVLPERMLSRKDGLGEKILQAAGMTPPMIETFRDRDRRRRCTARRARLLPLGRPVRRRPRWQGLGAHDAGLERRRHRAGPSRARS